MSDVQVPIRLGRKARGNTPRTLASLDVIVDDFTNEIGRRGSIGWCHLVTHSVCCPGPDVPDRHQAAFFNFLPHITTAFKVGGGGGRWRSFPANGRAPMRAPGW